MTSSATKPQVEIRDAFIAYGSTAIKRNDPDVTMLIENVHLCPIRTAWTPPFLRRPRVRRLRPYYRRARMCKALWAWSA
jgi:hypothetical protein